MASNETANALAKFNERVGDRHFREGIASACANVFTTCFVHGVTGTVKRESCDNDLRECSARYVDSCPEAVSSKEHTVACSGELLRYLAARHLVTLGKEGAVDLIKESLSTLAHLAQIKVTCKENKCAAFDVAGAPANHIGEVVEVETPLSRFRLRGVAGNVDAAVFLVVERRVYDFFFGCLPPNGFLERIHIFPVGEGGTSEHG